MRIHGTNQPSSIGQAVSSGCVRMLNTDVIDLYERVTEGTKVVVMTTPRKTAATTAKRQKHKLRKISRKRPGVTVGLSKSLRVEKNQQASTPKKASRSPILVRKRNFNLK
jgi:Mrp family chromosome partitioning ATPase